MLHSDHTGALNEQGQRSLDKQEKDG